MVTDQDLKITDQDLQEVELLFRSMCFDMKENPAYKEASESGVINTADTGNDATNKVKFKEIADDLCDFVDETFKDSAAFQFGGDRYTALDGGGTWRQQNYALAEPPSTLSGGDDIDAEINIDIDIQVNYPDANAAAEAFAC